MRTIYHHFNWSKFCFRLLPSLINLLLVLSCEFLQIFCTFDILLFQLLSFFSRNLPYLVHCFDYFLLFWHLLLLSLQLFLLLLNLSQLSFEVLYLFLQQVNFLSVLFCIFVNHLSHYLFFLLQLLIFLLQQRNESVIILRFFQKDFFLFLEISL
jgi:hypothetical protein